jgi:methylglutaconyl-CoA hydratase
MGYDTIDVSKKDGTAIVSLNRPEVHNAMNEQLMKELTKCFKELANDKTIRTIILTGKGKSFCAGADLNWMKSMVNYSKEENIRDSRLLLDLFETIYSCPKPVIGRINGHAFGGGLGLIAVCDITIAIPGLKFGFSEVKLGIIPSVISSFVAPRMTSADMRRLFITGERFDSKVAQDIGLIDFLVPPEEFDTKVDYYIDQLKSSGPIAIKEIKNLIKNLRMIDLDSYKKFTVEKISELRVSDEGQEGINAFLEKKKTKWGS